MAVSSMTGFARAAGSGGTWRWTFEVKSVNAKGLDIRLRMPAPFDRAEGEARARLAKALARGTCFATLTAQREGATAAAQIDLRGARIARRRGPRGGDQGRARAADDGRTARSARRASRRPTRRTTRRP